MQDPEKSLTAYFEREGEEMDPTYEQGGKRNERQYLCLIKLPITLSTGEPIFAEGTGAAHAMPACMCESYVQEARRRTR